mmetsp:Transcript_5311/g.15555  ORF Transcript_5311/g.15555 Transcript_5311/m.15555 type:complete len:405 (-) Transcript_5311:142-1356(-)
MLPDASLVAWQSLKAPAAAAGIKIGSIYNDYRIWGSGANAVEVASYEDVLTANFHVITPENACKPSAIYQTRTPDFRDCDRVIDWAEANGVEVRFHVSAWGDWNPDWMKALPAEEKQDEFSRYMREMLTHYKDRSGTIKYWDVLNEAVCDNVFLTPSKQNCAPGEGRPEDLGLLKGAEAESNWYPEIPNYFDLSFQIAREVLGPDSMLVYNDYGFESTEDPADPEKHQRVYDYVKAALDRGVPIDAVGFQLHIANIHGAQGIAGSIFFSDYMAGLKEQLAKFAALGIEVHITEIDVGCSFPTLPCTPSWARLDPTVRGRAQGAVYAAALEACLDVEGCTIYQMWGSTDKYSWRAGAWDPDEGDGEAADDGANSMYNQHAHIFDESLQPKTAAYSILGTLLARAA